jgi:hypothetical protein
MLTCPLQVIYWKFQKTNEERKERFIYQKGRNKPVTISRCKNQSRNSLRHQKKKITACPSYADAIWIEAAIKLIK